MLSHVVVKGINSWLGLYHSWQKVWVLSNMLLGAREGEVHMGSRGVDHGTREGKGWQDSRVSSRAGGACAKQRGLAVLGAVEAIRLITSARTKGALAIRVAPHAMLHAITACQA